MCLDIWHIIWCVLFILCYYYTVYSLYIYIYYALYLPAHFSTATDATTKEVLLGINSEPSNYHLDRILRVNLCPVVDKSHWSLHSHTVLLVWNLSRHMTRWVWAACHHPFRPDSHDFMVVSNMVSFTPPKSIPLWMKGWRLLNFFHGVAG